jgi:hypothetical protein
MQVDEQICWLVRTKAKLKAATAEYMQTLEASPELVKTYFHDPRVKYSA